MLEQYNEYDSIHNIFISDSYCLKAIRVNLFKQQQYCIGNKITVAEDGVKSVNIQ